MALGHVARKSIAFSCFKGSYDLRNTAGEGIFQMGKQMKVLR